MIAFGLYKTNRSQNKSKIIHIMEDFRALRDLILLLDENDHSDQIDTSSISEPLSDTSAPFGTFKCKSQCFPDLMTNPNIWSFLMGTVNDIKQMNIIPKPHNLTPAQTKAISKLQNHPDLEIKPADKARNIVLMTKTQYEHMVMNILCNKEWYVCINTAQIDQFKIEFLSLIGSAHQRGLIDQDLYNFLYIRNPRLATFYALPKIHKHSTTPPGRPIVSRIGSLAENASRLVDSI